MSLRLVTAPIGPTTPSEPDRNLQGAGKPEERAQEGALLIRLFPRPDRAPDDSPLPPAA